MIKNRQMKNSKSKKKKKSKAIMKTRNKINI